MSKPTPLLESLAAAIMGALFFTILGVAFGGWAITVLASLPWGWRK